MENQQDRRAYAPGALRMKAQPLNLRSVDSIDPSSSTIMDEKQLQGISSALARIPQGLYVLTAQHEEQRTGIIVSWVQQASFQPPMVSAAVGKGRQIMPLISESRWFTLCQVPKGDKVLLRKFASSPDPGDDPFMGMDLVNVAGCKSPVLVGSLSYLSCEVVCHMDIEGDHDLFIGRVRQAAYLSGEPHLHVRQNGLKY